MYWQHQCATYDPPPGQIVSEESAAGSGVTLGPVEQVMTIRDSRGTSAYRRHPDCWNELTSSWLNPRLTAKIAALGPVLFLHRLRNGATERIVMLCRYSSRWTDTDLSDTLKVEILVPGSWTVPPQFSVGYDVSIEGSIPSPICYRAKEFRLYAGRADPADPSHFTIAYEIDGKPGTIDGYLKLNGDVEVVDVKVRDGPGAAGRPRKGSATP
jgi:hypothetical protein